MSVIKAKQTSSIGSCFAFDTEKLLYECYPCIPPGNENIKSYKEHLPKGYALGADTKKQLQEHYPDINELSIEKSGLQSVIHVLRRAMKTLNSTNTADTKKWFAECYPCFASADENIKTHKLRWSTVYKNGADSKKWLDECYPCFESGDE